jgi:hypothetical protein
MSANVIELPNLMIQNIKADLVKGHVDITPRGRLTLEFMKLRPKLMELALDEKPIQVEITPPANLFDTITITAGDKSVTLGEIPL